MGSLMKLAEEQKTAAKQEEAKPEEKVELSCAGRVKLACAHLLNYIGAAKEAGYVVKEASMEGEIDQDIVKSAARLMVIDHYGADNLEKTAWNLGPGTIGTIAGGPAGGLLGGGVSALKGDIDFKKIYNLLKKFQDKTGVIPAAQKAGIGESLSDIQNATGVVPNIQRLLR